MNFGTGLIILAFISFAIALYLEYATEEHIKQLFGEKFSKDKHSYAVSFGFIALICFLIGVIIVIYNSNVYLTSEDF
jgi:uncharacterized membrane protein